MFKLWVPISDPNNAISYAPGLVDSESFTADAGTLLLSKAVLLKLNGGLGTFTSWDTNKGSGPLQNP